GNALAQSPLAPVLAIPVAARALPGIRPASSPNWRAASHLPASEANRAVRLETPSSSLAREPPAECRSESVLAAPKGLSADRPLPYREIRGRTAAARSTSSLSESSLQIPLL